eukprot:1161135-Pelagomonas_calceolata.AAC.13
MQSAMQCNMQRGMQRDPWTQRGAQTQRDLQMLSAETAATVLLLQRGGTYPCRHTWQSPLLVFPPVLPELRVRHRFDVRMGSRVLNCSQPSCTRHRGNSALSGVELLPRRPNNFLPSS